MSEFKLARKTKRGIGSLEDVLVGAMLGRPLGRAMPEWVALGRRRSASISIADSIADFVSLHRQHQLLAWAESMPQTILHALGSSAYLSLYLNPSTLTLTCSAIPDVLHYFRLAEATVKPLPPDPEPLAFAPGDAYIALTPGARRVADSPAIARFLHPRDDFNADRLAASLLDHLVEFAGKENFPEDVTVLVVEAR